MEFFPFYIFARSTSDYNCSLPLSALSVTCPSWWRISLLRQSVPKDWPLHTYKGQPPALPWAQLWKNILLSDFHAETLLYFHCFWTSPTPYKGSLLFLPHTSPESTTQDISCMLYSTSKPTSCLPCPMLDQYFSNIWNYARITVIIRLSTHSCSINLVCCIGKAQDTLMCPLLPSA